VVVEGERQLLEMVATLSPMRSLASRLNGRKQQGDQHANDRDDHQQFHQGKRSAA